MTLIQRRRQPELMDEPDLDPALHARALDGLRRINRFSRTAAALWPAIREAARHTPERPVRVLDVGSGGGDLLIRLAAKARSSGLDARFSGCDISDFAVDYARRHAASEGIDTAEFFEHDILSAPLPETCHVAMCSLFLHHFDEADAVLVMTRLARAARVRILIQDLRRSRTGYVLAWLGCRLLSSSPIVHVDGPLSVAGAFTMDEVRRLARRAPFSEIRIDRRWPQRFLLSARPAL